MSKEYQNNFRGVLFVNDRRKTDKHPHYQGQCEVDEVQYWVSGWIKEPKKGGNDFISLSLQEKEAAKDAPRPDKDDPNLQGVLFVNERKDTDAKPDYTGRCTIEDVEYWLNAWIKAPREAGDDFISIEFEKSAARSTGRLDAKAMLAQVRSRGLGQTQSEGQSSHRDPAPAGGKDDFDDDIPFSAVVT